MVHLLTRVLQQPGTLPRVHLEHVALAAAISLQRLDDWWTGTARAGTRISRFAALAA
jgi:hypothetical protein